LQVFADLRARGRQPTQDPAVLDRQFLDANGARRVTLEVEKQETGGVPELVGEVAANLEALRRLLRRGQFRVVRWPGATGAERLLALRTGDLARPHVHVLELDWNQLAAVRAYVGHRHAHVLRLGRRLGNAEAQRVGT